MARDPNSWKTLDSNDNDDADTISASTAPDAQSLHPSWESPEDLRPIHTAWSDILADELCGPWDDLTGICVANEIARSTTSVQSAIAWSLQEQLLANPNAFIEATFRTVLAVTRSTGYKPPKIQLRFRTGNEAYFESLRTSFPRRGYRLLVTSAFPMLLFELAEYYTSQLQHVSATGEILAEAPGRSPEFATDKFAYLIKTAVEIYVSQRRRWNFSEEIRDNLRDRVFREEQYSEFQRRGAVRDTIRQLMLMFTIAHEIGHVALGHCDNLNVSTDIRRRRELQADAYAAMILMQYVQVPPVWWEFASGSVTSDAFAHEMRRLGLLAAAWHGDPVRFGLRPAPATGFKMYTVFGLQAVACIFALFDLAEKAIEGREKETMSVMNKIRSSESAAKWYPSADERWQSFRQVCITKLDVPADVFTDFNGVTGPVDLIFERFRYLTADISWGS